MRLRLQTFGPSYEIVVAGTQNPDDTRTILDELHLSFTPNKLLMLKTPGLDSLLEYTKKMGETRGKPSIYICRDRACSLPLNNVNDALEDVILGYAGYECYRRPIRNYIKFNKRIKKL